jgi:hypothetical protein
MDTQTCKICKQNKLLIDFNTGKYKTKNGEIKIYFYKKCKICDRERLLIKSRRSKDRHRKEIAAKQREYHKLHKENDSLTKKKWYQKNKEHAKRKSRENICLRRKNDVLFRLKESVSARVREYVIKNDEPVKNFLPYSIEQLRIHLESLFESWMNWDNWGVYRIKSWDDNDQSTWTWQIDHIIPHSTFHYESMEDEIFKKCWALENLRPYSAKQNVMDGDRFIES